MLEGDEVGGAEGRPGRGGDGELNFISRASLL